MTTIQEMIDALPWEPREPMTYNRVPMDAMAFYQLQRVVRRDAQIALLVRALEEAYDAGDPDVFGTQLDAEIQAVLKAVRK